MPLLLSEDFFLPPCAERLLLAPLEALARPDDDLESAEDVRLVEDPEDLLLRAAMICSLVVDLHGHRSMA